jgi:hypothetical protein
VILASGTGPWRTANVGWVAFLMKDAALLAASFYLLKQDLVGATVRTMSLLSRKRWCDEAIQRMTHETPGGSVRGMVASPQTKEDDFLPAP